MYHWVRDREGTIGIRFEEKAVAGNPVLECTSDQSRMFFGLGPALGAGQAENRSCEILAALGSDLEGLRWGRQVHGCEVTVIDGVSNGGLAGTACIGSCDALITARPGVGLMVWTADCVPLLLEGPGVVAAIHSGWRGTASDIVGVVVGRIEAEYGISAERISVALGPAISGQHYEVGPEVVEALESIDSGYGVWRWDDHVDLRLFLAGRLRRLGVPKESITIVGPCTFSTASLASYRRDGDAAGRQFSLVFLRR